MGNKCLRECNAKDLQFVTMAAIGFEPVRFRIAVLNVPIGVHFSEPERRQARRAPAIQWPSPET